MASVNPEGQESFSPLVKISSPGIENKHGFVPSEGLQSILDASGEAIIIADEYRNIVIFNDQARAVFRFLPEDVLGKPFSILLPERYRNQYQTFINKFLLSNTKNIRARDSLRVAGMRSNGDEFPADLAVSKFVDQGNIYLSTILLDKTELNSIDQQLRSYSNKLRQTSQNFQEFISIASQDLNEPLRKISVFGDRLKDNFMESLDPKGKEYLDHLRKATSTMQSLMDDLSKFTKVTTRSNPYQPIELNDVFKSLLRNLKGEISDDKAKVIVNDLPTIEGDRQQIVQMFKELLLNALKFSKNNENPSITIGSKKGPHNTWEISIEDNGIGIQDQHTSRIFKPYQRLHGKDRFGGNGMGLTICQKIVHRHSGQITVKAVPKQGSTFFITLPEKQLGKK